LQWQQCTILKKNLPLFFLWLNWPRCLAHRRKRKLYHDLPVCAIVDSQHKNPPKPHRMTLRFQLDRSVFVNRRTMLLLLSLSIVTLPSSSSEPEIAKNSGFCDRWWVFFYGYEVRGRDGSDFSILFLSYKIVIIESNKLITWRLVVHISTATSLMTSHLIKIDPNVGWGIKTWEKLKLGD
jgi:hypothetical protein